MEKFFELDLRRALSANPTKWSKTLMGTRLIIEFYFLMKSSILYQ